MVIFDMLLPAATHTIFEVLVYFFFHVRIYLLHGLFIFRLVYFFMQRLINLTSNNLPVIKQGIAKQNEHNKIQTEKSSYMKCRSQIYITFKFFYSFIVFLKRLVSENQSRFSLGSVSFTLFKFFPDVHKTILIILWC